MYKDAEQKRQRTIGYLMFGEEYDEIDDDLLDVLMRLVAEFDLKISVEKDRRSKAHVRLKVKSGKRVLLSLDLHPRGRYERDDTCDIESAKKLLEELRDGNQETRETFRIGRAEPA